MCLIANGLIMLENTLLDNRKLSSLDAIVVIAGGREPTFSGSIAPYIDDVAPDPLFTHLVDSEETRAREVGFVAQSAV